MAAFFWIPLFLTIALAYVVLLSETGLLGPDEPRYCAIGREMATSGDWITPRLWGQDWFEKPPLLYWLVASAHALGLKDEAAARVPVVGLSLLSLCFYWFALSRLAGRTAALASTLMLATSAGWIAFSHAAVTDLPLAAFFSAALLSLLLDLDRGWRAGRWLAGVLFGLALLAKGLTAVVLALPVLWFARTQWRRLLAPAVTALLVSGVWYGPMFALHGRAFFDEFILKHHFGRFTSDALQHQQPFWFYLPVLLGWLYPWTPLFVSVRPAREESERWDKVLLVTVLLGFIFFSISTNKLPGYILPLMPLVFALLGQALAARPAMPRAIFWTGFALFLIPVAATVLPDALLRGLSRTTLEETPWEYPAGALAIGLAAAWFESHNRRAMALGLLGLSVAAGIVYVKLSAFPVLDQVVSARALAQRVVAAGQPVCVESLHRAVRYGLNYYTVTPLPDCEAVPRPVQIVQAPGGLPSLRKVE